MRNEQQVVINSADILEVRRDYTHDRVEIWFRGEPRIVDASRPFREQFLNEWMPPVVASLEVDGGGYTSGALGAWNADPEVKRIGEILAEANKKVEREVNVIEILRAGVVLR